MDDIKQYKSINLHKRIIFSDPLLCMWYRRRIKGLRKIEFNDRNRNILYSLSLIDITDRV